METLEKLSNNEIRLKCIEHGLPNIPVTDSSRKLLIKRLNDAMNNAASKESTKASNRRETISITKTSPPEVEVQKNRRTISATTVIAAKEDNPPTSIPISNRRRFSQKDVSESTKQIKDYHKPMESILIEDDEDDMELMNAAENAEKTSTTSSVPIENITGRRKSRSVSVPKQVSEAITAVTAAAKKRVMTPLIEDKLEPSQHQPKQQVAQKEQLTKTVKPQAVPNEKVVNILSVQKLPSIETPIALTQQHTLPQMTVDEKLSHYTAHNTTPSVYSTPSSMRYTLGSGLTTANTASASGVGYVGSSQSAYRSKYLSDFNELSDTDLGNDDGCKSPFLSNFARDLERRRSVGRSTTGGPGYGQFVRRSSGVGYEKTAIRGRRSSKADVSIGQIALALGRKYHLKKVFYSLVLVCIAIFIYVYLYAPSS